MSLLIHELSQIVDRVLILAPSDKHLKQLFELLSVELTTLTGRRQNLDLQMAAIPKGSIQSWASFTLGIRGKLKVRISLMGSSLQTYNPSKELLEIADAIFIWLPPNEERNDQFLALKIPPGLGGIPCLVAGLFEDEPSLRTLAITEWTKRNFQKTLFLKNPDDFLREGLEWVLSF